MATHSRIFAWKIPQRSLEGYSPCDRKELDTTEMTEHAHTKENSAIPSTVWHESSLVKDWLSGL